MGIKRFAQIAYFPERKGWWKTYPAHWGGVVWLTPYRSFTAFGNTREEVENKIKAEVDKYTRRDYVIELEV